jgi:Na+-translocating ferredoxin:NAD+ oxidoreductase RNF subunit RnfB
MDWGLIATIIVTLSIIGFLFGFLLALADKFFGIELDPRIHKVEDILPKGQCGACGFAGCAAYAEAVVTDKYVSPGLCRPGGKDLAKLIARITGKEPETIEGVKAYVMCQGTPDKAFIYKDELDCASAALLFGGDSVCPYSCLGYGTCIGVCPFGAISSRGSKIIIDHNKCTGCGMCASACPKHVIQMIPEDTNVVLLCVSEDKGSRVKQICSIGCIGCGICSKGCKEKAIKIEDNIAKIDYKKCTQCTHISCLDKKCPTGALVSLSS